MVKYEHSFLLIISLLIESNINWSYTRNEIFLSLSIFVTVKAKGNKFNKYF